MVDFKIKFGLVFILIFSGLSLSGQKYYDTRRLSFDTPAKELAPVFYKNGLVFCSDRRSTLFLNYTDYDNNQLTNLYWAELKRHGRFENPQLFSKELTTFLFEGPATFSKDGKTIYFTRTNGVSVKLSNKQREDTTFGIFSADLVNGKWTNITPFRFNRPNYNVGFPSLSADGKLLFFSSDDPSGYGGFDIYVSKWENGRWSIPENLGKKINTPKNEVFPFIHESGRLYFASRGLNGRGDLDIYYTLQIDGQWQNPVRLPAPINSESDDYGLVMNAAMDTGYFTSDRAASADIYMVFSTLPAFNDCPAQQKNDYCYVFYETNNTDIDTTTMAFEWDLGDGTKIRALEADHCFASPGKYLVQLNVIDKLTKEVYYSQASYEFTVEDIEQPYISGPDTVYVDEPVTLDGKKTYLKNFDINGYYWDFGDGTLDNDIVTQHAYTQPGVYSIRLGVTSKPADNKTPIQKRCISRPIVVISKPKNGN